MEEKKVQLKKWERGAIHEETNGDFMVKKKDKFPITNT